ncbi:hypothetical protein [Salibacterium aidingense]|uniref:hypothetical protein n=1 Tax=Salibacterium aidingense TaxID=384933 RepID=UPI000415039F|nr:hypothetical protein [Salibacterium aidingense]
MSWGEYHDLPYQSGLEEKIIGPFSFNKLAWLVPSILISNQLASVVDTLPFTNNLIFERLHLAVPIVIAAVFAYFKHGKTNLSLLQTILSYFRIRRRKRTFYYHKQQLLPPHHS